MTGRISATKHLSVLTSKGARQIGGSLCRKDVVGLTFSSISIIVLYPTLLQQILQSLFLVHLGLQDESCLKTESTIYIVYAFQITPIIILEQVFQM